MTSARSSRHHTHSATSTSSRTTESPTSSHYNNSESDTVLVAKKLSSVSLVEREERQQALDRLEILKTVRIDIMFFSINFILEYRRSKSEEEIIIFFEKHIFFSL
jgi:hypothetical protein